MLHRTIVLPKVHKNHENIKERPDSGSEEDLDIKRKILTTSMELLFYQIFHSRFMHPGQAGMAKALSLCDSKIEGPAIVDCQACNLSKIKTLPFSEQMKKASRVLQRIHSDLTGPLKESNSGYHCICTFMDEYSHLVTVFLLKKKSEDFTSFKECITYAKSRHSGQSITTLMMNNGSEYVNLEFVKYLKKE
eukprot:Ihof_evm1s7 gene=Ihof_evmTU1s7